jgi:hypothetical protein
MGRRVCGRIGGELQWRCRFERSWMRRQWLCEKVDDGYCSARFLRDQHGADLSYSESFEKVCKVFTRIGTLNLEEEDQELNKD